VLDGRALQLVPSAFQWEGPVAVIDFTETRTDPARFYTPDVYRRLRAVKAGIDPHNIVRAHHPIAPAA
jgi:hypothetical protein